MRIKRLQPTPPPRGGYLAPLGAAESRRYHEGTGYMKATANTRRIVEALAARGAHLVRGPQQVVHFTGNARADQALNAIGRYPHLFVLGCIMDRQMRAERAWAIPFDLGQTLGGLSFRVFRGASLDRIERFMTHPAPRHRFTSEMSRNLHEGIGLISTEYGGRADRIWADKPTSAEVIYRFLRFRGVGIKIASMAANLLVRDFHVPFADYYSIDVSPDTHVRRVFVRLGLVGTDATPEQIVFCARALNPTFPGLLDFAAWRIDRDCCKPQEPLCEACDLQRFCKFGSRS